MKRIRQRIRRWRLKRLFPTARDYARLFEMAKCILDSEFLKPSNDWDEDLIEELEETMLYCAERERALLAEKKKNPV